MSRRNGSRPSLYHVEWGEAADGGVRLTLHDPRGAELAVFRCASPEYPRAQEKGELYAHAAKRLNEAMGSSGRQMRCAPSQAVREVLGALRRGMPT